MRVRPAIRSKGRLRVEGPGASRERASSQRRSSQALAGKPDTSAAQLAAADDPGGFLDNGSSADPYRQQTIILSLLLVCVYKLPTLPNLSDT
jgi:hypothetical protein